MIKKNNFKTRDISVLELLGRLEVEYVVWELRRKIYPDKKMKSYYEKGMGFKKERILDISLRNNIPNMFTDDKRRQRAYSEVYVEGYPNFHYRDECLKETLENLDRTNYYYPNSDIRVIGSSDIGKIVSVDFDKEEIIIIIGNANQKISLNKVIRIL